MMVAFYYELDDIRADYRQLMLEDNQQKTIQSSEEDAEDAEEAEEANAANEIRLAKMQEQIDALLEHERIFDTLVTKLYERVDKLDNSTIKEKDKKPALAPKPCIEYVDYHMY
jgi:hypothetical protein